MRPCKVQAQGLQEPHTCRCLVLKHRPAPREMGTVRSPPRPADSKAASRRVSEAGWVRSPEPPLPPTADPQPRSAESPSHRRTHSESMTSSRHAASSRAAYSSTVTRGHRPNFPVISFIGPHALARPLPLFEVYNSVALGTFTDSQTRASVGAGEVRTFRH